MRSCFSPSRYVSPLADWQRLSFRRFFKGEFDVVEYDCLGNKLALMKGLSTIDHAFAALPGGGTVVYTGGAGPFYYRHAEWLGSSRFSSTPGRTMHTDLAFAPFGEQYAVSGGVGVEGASFAGMNEDTNTRLYDAQFREYGIQGRLLFSWCILVQL